MSGSTVEGALQMHHQIFSSAIDVGQSTRTKALLKYGPAQGGSQTVDASPVMPLPLCSTWHKVHDRN